MRTGTGPARQGEQRLRLAGGLAIAVLIVAGLAVSRLGFSTMVAWADAVTAWARGAGPLGWAAFALLQAAIAMVGVIPASLLGIAAGAVYGLPGGFALSTIGTLLGGWAAFRLARSLLRPWVERLIEHRGGGRLGRLDAAVTRDGWRFVCLLRISPVMPFALTSYALGLTEISGREYLVGTLASLPALAGYVGFGALARYGMLTASGTAPSGPINYVLLAAGAIATAALIFRSGTLLARCGLLPGTYGGKRPI